jgi:hypothetical protein
MVQNGPIQLDSLNSRFGRSRRVLPHWSVIWKFDNYVNCQVTLNHALQGLGALNRSARYGALQLQQSGTRALGAAHADPSRMGWRRHPVDGRKLAALKGEPQHMHQLLDSLATKVYREVHGIPPGSD